MDEIGQIPLISPSGARWEPDEGCIRIVGKNCVIWIEPRPVYCDRGNFIAKISEHSNAPIPGKGPPLYMDDADGWPRYYFDLARAKLEVEAWLKKRGQALF